MKSFIAFFKKEFMEFKRSGKLIILLTLFVILGLMNPAIAKLTPLMFKLLEGSLAESGIEMTNIEVNALTSWTQFFKNMPLGLIAFGLLYAGIFTNEYKANTLVLILTKGLSRTKVLFAKLLMMFLIWTLGYFLAFFITYIYNDIYWDNSIVTSLMSPVINLYLFGIFVIVLIVFLSTIFKNQSEVTLLGTGSIFLCYIISLFKRVNKLMPTSLMNTSNLLVGNESPKDYLITIIITIIVCIILSALSIHLFNKKEI